MPPSLEQEITADSLYLSGSKHEFQEIKVTHDTSFNITKWQKQWSQDQLTRSY